MGWAEGDLKIFAAGLAIGGEWNMGADQLPPPTADPPPGPYYGQTLHVTLRTTVAGAVIRYTTDGTVPSAEGAKFQEEQRIEIDKNKTLCAYAQKENRTSRVAEFHYRVENPLTPQETIALSRHLVLGTETLETVLGDLSLECSEDIAITDGILRLWESGPEIRNGK